MHDYTQVRICASYNYACGASYTDLDQLTTGLALRLVTCRAFFEMRGAVHHAFVTPSPAYYKIWTSRLVMNPNPPHLMDHNGLQQAALTAAVASVIFVLCRTYSRPSVKDIPGPPNPSWVHGRLRGLIVPLFIFLIEIRRSSMVLADSGSWCR